jgi:hypothetical protein
MTNNGRFGENVVARFLRARGNSILPIRDIDMGEVWKGPRLTGPEGMELVSTDWFVIGPQGKSCWMEVKTKARFSWHQRTASWCTGIDQHYLDHYINIARRSNIPVWLIFLHLNDSPSTADLKNGAPEHCPTGLFGGDVLHLAKEEMVHHAHSNWGKGGMVYWAPKKLVRLATSEEIEVLLREERRGQR